MAKAVGGLFGIKTPTAPPVTGPSQAQVTAQTDQAAALARQEALTAQNLERDAAARRARGASGRALLLNNEVGVPSDLSKTLGD